MIDDKITVMNHFRYAKRDLLGVEEQVVMAKGFETFDHSLGATAWRTCGADDPYAHKMRIALFENPFYPRW